MAEKKVEKKRKAAPLSTSPSAKKAKPSKATKDSSKAAAKSAPVEKATVIPSSDKLKRVEKPSRKKAAEYFSDSESESEHEEKQVKTVAPTKKDKKEKSSKKQEKPVKEVAEDSASESEESDIQFPESDDEEDQSGNLLKGFGSSDEEDEEEGAAAINKSKRLTLPAGAKDKANSAPKTGGPGVIYISRIPHGFYEHEMRSYFSQFGTVTRLRLSRNKKTGRSKHYAFVEFADAGVAQIAAETMDNYLLAGRILRCRFVEKISEEEKERVFKGANKRFKAMPRAKIEKRRHDAPKTKEAWEKVVGREEKRREEKKRKLKELGIEYDFEVAKPVVVDGLTEEKAEEPEKSGEPLKKKAKKQKKAITEKGEEVPEDKEAEEAVKEAVKAVKSKKGKSLDATSKKAEKVAVPKKKKRATK